jgi:trans-aconitate 2-methyltransferase
MSTQNEIRQFYDSFSRTLIRDFSYLNLRQNAIRDMIKRLVPRGAGVLEVGCGVGIITRALQRRAGKVVSIDISPENIEIARLYAPAKNTEFLVVDVLEEASALDRFGKFDVVLLADVVEHIPIPRYDVLFGAIEARLSPSGVVLMTYPTPEHQVYLREHQPEIMQVVDERVELENLLRATKLQLLSFQYRNIWRRNDYVHVVLTADRSFSPELMPLSPGGWLINRLRKYRWRFRNLMFLRKLKKRLAR